MMPRFGAVLLGLILFATGCGGGADDGDGRAPGQEGAADPVRDVLEAQLEAEGSADESGAGAPEEDDATDPVRDALEAGLEPALLRDLPLLDEEEAACITDAFLAVLPDLETAPGDPILLAGEMLTGVQAAQERCLTPERIAELEAGQAPVRTPEPAESAFLLAVRAAVEGLDAGDQELVGGGRLVCGLAEGAGSLDALLARLEATPEASASLAEDLSPSLGGVLETEELLTFSTMAVATLCPEFSD